MRRIVAARERQQARTPKLHKPGLLANGDIGGQHAGLAEVQTFCQLDDA